METVSHREMRNKSGELLRRVEAGESVVITNRGRAAAIIGPIHRNALDDLIDSNGATPATQPVGSLRTIERKRSSVPSHQLIDDSRGDW